MSKISLTSLISGVMNMKAMIIVARFSTIFPAANRFLSADPFMDASISLRDVPNSDPMIIATAASNGMAFAYNALSVIAIVAVLLCMRKVITNPTTTNTNIGALERRIRSTDPTTPIIPSFMKFRAMNRKLIPRKK